jgi:hypothetical protein
MSHTLLVFHLFIALLFCSPQSVRAQFHLAFENPIDGATGGITVVSGWVFDERPDVTITQVEFLLNGSKVQTIPCCSSRADVGSSFPQFVHAANSGFGAIINWGELQEGSYFVKVRVTNSRAETLESDTRAITVVRLGACNFVDEFDFSEATSTVVGQLVVLQNVKVHCKATGQWITTTLQYRPTVGIQGLQLSSVLTFSGRADVTYVSDQTANPFQKVKTAIEDTGMYFHSQFGVGPDNYNVFTFDDVNSLLTAYLQWYRLPESERATTAQRWNSGQIAESGYSNLFVHTEGQWKTFSSAEQLGILSHEAFHVLQHALVGFPGLNRERDDQVPFGGPRWLIEGSAVLVSTHMVVSQGFWTLANVRADWISRVRGTSFLLQSTETWTGMLAAGTDKAYPLGALAVEYLLADQGLAPLAEFWEAVGKSGKWQEAFTDLLTCLERR